MGESLTALHRLPMIILAALLVILPGGLATDEPSLSAILMADLPVAPAKETCAPDFMLTKAEVDRFLEVLEDIVSRKLA